MARFVLALAVFCASGFAALLYQVSWQRMLALFSGADVYSATVIVAAFMAGLGVGHLAGGRMADRVSRRTSLVLFGAAEAAIAVFGLLSTTFFYGFLYQQLGHLAIAPQWLPAILFGSLLLPTFLMGASLPLLARAMTATVSQASWSIGWLYGANTLGAALGALAATWWLLPYRGVEGSLTVAVALNVACAAVVLPFALWFTRPAARESDATPQEAALVRGQGLWFWAVVYGYSGFIALSLEIVWFRLLGVMVKSTAFTFGTLLALYLAGLGLGAVFGSVVARRSRRPGLTFLGLQTAAGLCAAIVLAAFVGMVSQPGVLRTYFAGYEPLAMRDSVDAISAVAADVLRGRDGPAALPSMFLRLYLGLPLLLIVPATLLMGSSFAFLQRVVQTDARNIGSRVGLLLMANIAGSVLGTVVTGRWLLAWLGTAGTFKLLAAMTGVFAVASLALGVSRRRVIVAGAASAVVALVAAWMPGGHQLWAALHGTTPDRLIVAEDDTGLSVIKLGPRGLENGAFVFVNGLGQSTIPYGGIHTALGALPAFIHPDPKDALTIGLGSGDTLHAMAGRPGLERITSIEIVKAQMATLVELDGRHSYAGLRQLLRDPRIEHLVGDGRAYLLRTRRTFDLIEADALRPTSAFAGNLYSEEYFRLVRDHLKPDGLAATWEPSTTRVRATFLRVFPYVISLPDVLLGSHEPIPFDPVAVHARLKDPRVQEYYQRAGIDITQLLVAYLNATPVRYGPEFDRSSLTDFNTDLFPRDEYGLKRPSR